MWECRKWVTICGIEGNLVQLVAPLVLLGLVSIFYYLKSLVSIFKETLSCHPPTVTLCVAIKQGPKAMWPPLKLKIETISIVIYLRFRLHTGGFSFILDISFLNSCGCDICTLYIVWKMSFSFYFQFHGMMINSRVCPNSLEQNYFFLFHNGCLNPEYHLYVPFPSFASTCMHYQHM